MLPKGGQTATPHSQGVKPRNLRHASTHVVISYIEVISPKTAKLLTEINLLIVLSERRRSVFLIMPQHTNWVQNQATNEGKKVISPGVENRRMAYRSQMDDSLGGHRASHEANKLQLGTIFSDCSHRSVSNLEEKKVELLFIFLNYREYYPFYLKKFKCPCFLCIYFAVLIGSRCWWVM